MEESRPAKDPRYLRNDEIPVALKGYRCVKCSAPLTYGAGDFCNACHPTHTLGTWEAIGLEVTEAPRPGDSTGATIATVERQPRKGEERANVRLIAAAPDMLAALREAEAAVVAVNAGAGVTLFNPATLAVIREAIAKAEGM